MKQHPARPPAPPTLLLLAALGLTSCSGSSSDPAITSVDFASVGDLTIVGQAHEDPGARLWVGACIVQEQDRAAVVYAWLARTPGGSPAPSMRSVDCQCDGTRASVAESIQHGDRTVSLAAAVTRRSGGPGSEQLRLDGVLADPMHGRLFLLDLRGSEPVRQVALALPPPPVLAGSSSEIQASTRDYVRDLLPSLRAEPQLQAFLTVR